MAIDRKLLCDPPPEVDPTIPFLRWYEWREPAVTYGYFQTEADVRAHFPDAESIEFTQRWTGGGIVDHRRDQTYSLIVPRNADLASLRPATTYREIHRRLSAALQEQGLPAALATDARTESGATCFQGGTVPSDVLLHGQKIAGAAQRRTRQGFLHQGSVLVTEPIHRETFANQLTQTVLSITIAEVW